MRKFTLSFIWALMLISIHAYATDYTLGTSRITINEPGSHAITGTGSGGCTVYIVKESADLSDAVYHITLRNFYLKAGSWASAIVLENNAASGSMKVNFLVEGDNYTSGYNHGGIKAEKGAMSVVFTTSATGKLTCDAQYSGTYALQAADGTTFNASIDPLVYGAGVLNNVNMEVNAAMAGAFAAKPLVILLSKKPLFEANGIWYSVLSEENKTVEVVMGREPYKGNIEIPASTAYNGSTYTVAAIGDNAFKGCTSLTGIEIPGSVERIGNQAFCDCSSLEEITVNWEDPGDVTYGDGIFAGVTASGVTFSVPAGTESLYKVIDTWKGFDFEKTGQQIGTSDAYWEIVDGVLIISGTGEMPNYTYQTENERPWYSDKASVTKVVIEEGITKTGSYAFDAFSNLTSITLPSTLKELATSSFSNCSQLDNVTIPGNVEIIASSCFAQCSNLTSLILSEGVKTLGSSAFTNCRSLATVAIPGTVTSILSNTFSYTGSLTDFVVNEENTAYCSQDGVLFTKDKTKLVRYPQNNARVSYDVPDGVVTIGSLAFSSNSKLTAITLPNSVKTVESSGFFATSKIASLTLSENLESIDSYAFYNLKITSLTLPGSLTYIGTQAFYDCKALEEVIVKWTTPGDVTYGADIFAGVTVSEVKLVVPEGTEELYAAIDTWTDFKAGGSAQQIGESGVYWEIVDGILKITGAGDMPDFTNSGKQPWASERASVTEIEISEGVTWIGTYAFADCNQVMAVLFPATVAGIGDLAFSGCTALSSVTIPESVATIGISAFLGCTGLADLTIFEGVVGIGRAAFSGCEGLTAIHIPASVKSIANSVFAIDALTDITVDEENTVYSSQDGVLYNKELTALLQYPRGHTRTSYTIPEGVILIGDSAFIGGNKNLTEIILPATLQEIRPVGFYGCSAITSLDLPESLEIIGAYAFYSCTGLTEVTVNWAEPDAVTYGNAIFYGVATEDVKLYTPGATKDFYAAVDTWKDFDIQGIYSSLKNVASQASNLSVFASEGGVRIESAKAGQVAICTVGGLFVKEVQITEGSTVVSLPFGQYLVNGKLILVK